MHKHIPDDERFVTCFLVFGEKKNKKKPSFQHKMLFLLIKKQSQCVLSVVHPSSSHLFLPIRLDYSWTYAADVNHLPLTIANGTDDGWI